MPISPWHPEIQAEFVGAAQCQSCHPQAFVDWQKSDHHRAMEPATPDTVLGDFSGVTFHHFGHETRFYRQDGKYWIHTEGPDGKPTDYEVAYTFGFYPLQQYLIAFPGGRYQAFQVCWDSRPADAGGQRWYHLYPDEEIPPGDVLHWTGPNFNWNFMCADCHSTNLRKNFDVPSLTYHTEWSEMNVGCEACHGPGSAHIDWAKASAQKSDPETTKPDLGGVADYLESKGLLVSLREKEEAAWPVDPTTELPKRSVPLGSTVQVETCARCHSHRQPLQAVHEAGHSFLDTHDPSVLSESLYQPDGQIREEVYVYGSFLQSRMYHAGVRCTDCHHPHTMKLVASGNALCVRCHQPEKYNTPTHHFHPVGSTGASCVDCHMPVKHYMVVDGRRDHSLRKPRPDLSVKLGTPNACNICHTDKDAGWAAEAFAQWWGKGPRNEHYGETLAAIREGGPKTRDRLLALATDRDRSGIVRATAFSEIPRLGPDASVEPTLTAGFADADPLVREEAVAALESFPPQVRVRLGCALLQDPVRAVRVEAARVLAAARSLMNEEQGRAFDTAGAEYLERMEAISDRAAGHAGRGMYFSQLGKPKEAEDAYRTAFKVDPTDIGSRVNLSDLMRQQGRIVEEEALLQDAIRMAPQGLPEQVALAHDALARCFVRSKRYEEALAEMRTAVTLAPRNAELQYFLGVALNSLNRYAEAVPHLTKAHELAPRHAEYLIALATVHRDAGRIDEAVRAARDLVALDPENREYLGLLQQLQSVRP